MSTAKASAMPEPLVYRREYVTEPFDPRPEVHVGYAAYVARGALICMECSWLEDGYIVPWPCYYADGTP